MKKIALILCLLLIPFICDAQQIIITKKKSAGASYVAAKAVLYTGTDAGSGNFKICIYNGTTGALLTNGCSNAVAFASNTSITATFTSGPTLTASASYIIGLIGDAQLPIITNATAWSNNYDTSGSYASPPSSVTPPTEGDGNGNNGAGVVRMYITNASDQILIGSNEGSTSYSYPYDTYELIFRSALYTCNTL